MQEVNEHGLECPVPWGEIGDYIHWLATDENGDVYGYCERPIPYEDIWADNVQRFSYFICEVEPPEDFTKCLWQRPKTNGQ